ncbi:Hypothetical protein R9X50_00357600 [Acrodontium crateriforme]|uniref:WW domain-containing protein n=1 Tax=Acrodontium crateriforme TaxID=150365 RepID=A0AAQ3M6F6_9PEZI|nr:Hypothetical protein R9X50_00357600 [Acrodontium crateriforme]
MESPHKRLKPSPSDGVDFVSFSADNDNEVTGLANKYGFDTEETSVQAHQVGKTHTNGRPHTRDGRFDRRNAQDRPKSKHLLPGNEPWILVRTKFGRRFVHNTQTKESFWRIPESIFPAVKELEQWEEDQKEKAQNAKWAEEQLKELRPPMKPSQTEVTKSNDVGNRNRRRRSESLQREDEEAMMAELAAEEKRAGTEGSAQNLRTVEPAGPQVGDTGYDSDGSYEYVEVTDSEGEEAGGGDPATVQHSIEADDPMAAVEDQADEEEEEAVIEFGEDDIAYQLAAMGQDYGLDRGEYADYDDQQEVWDEGAEAYPFSEDDAINLFRDLLDDFQISPYTPWDKLISNSDPETSILHDDRYTVLNSMRARKEAWDAWAKDKAAQLKAARAQMEKLDPRISYLAFLSEKATPKLYWPEFKRKYKKEAELNDRKLSDKDREKLYRDHIARLKLSESARKADLITLLKSIPLRDLNRDVTLDALPQQCLTHLHFISLPSNKRDPIVVSHIRSLPPAPDAEGVLSEAQREEEEKKRAERRKREAALAARERQVDEERRRAEKAERMAKRDLREGERELQMAVTSGTNGVR